jgi:hypothetical protein
MSNDPRYPNDVSLDFAIMLQSTTSKFIEEYGHNMPKFLVDAFFHSYQAGRMDIINLENGLLYRAAINAEKERVASFQPKAGRCPEVGDEV